MSNDDNNDLNSKVAVLLIGVGSAAIVVTIYHFLAMTMCCRRYRPARNPQEAQPYVNGTSGNSIECSRAQLIPAYNYQSGMGLIGDDGTCAICLSEFEEGEELRTLPLCLHSYHAACIDMWLYSHSNCPMCRTDATPSPQVFLNARVLGQFSYSPISIMSDGGGDDITSKIAVLLIGVGSAVLIITLYHCIATRRFRARTNQQRPQQYRIETIATQSSVENSTAQLIPAYKYEKGMGLVGDDGTCAICLSEFEEDEELRTLPVCSHSYHVECIDMWLHSHTNCPMCRTDTTPSPRVYLRGRDLDSERASVEYQNIGRLQDIIVHSRVL
ncbi:unnamed protein product [Dovyalis caffra]|uniref:RING-type domain-containing protein n=1 Tax=Dovyalis caffra TaxID=77055 RepID=A0AAV1QV38_9ROSI|nr:unnamed protein product [Dovyalis caffra]